MRVGGDDGELRPWHHIYVYSIESRLIMRVRYDPPTPFATALKHPAGRRVDWERARGHASDLRTTNPHDTTKSTNLRVEMYLDRDPQKGSIYSTDLYRGVNIPIFGNESIGPIVRAGGTHLYRTPTQTAPRLRPHPEDNIRANGTSQKWTPP